MKCLIMTPIVLLASTALADGPKAPTPVDQNAMAIYDVEEPQTVVIDIDVALGIVSEERPSTTIDRPVTAEAQDPSTETIELDASPVKIVNRTRHFRITSKHRTPDAIPALGDIPPSADQDESDK